MREASNQLLDRWKDVLTSLSELVLKSQMNFHLLMSIYWTYSSLNFLPFFTSPLLSFTSLISC